MLIYGRHKIQLSFIMRKSGKFIMEQDLEYIYAVCMAGSFSRAAENLHVTQPALSMAVKRVESAIGMSLFDRKARPVELTEAGKIYLEAIREITAIEDDMNAKIRDIHGLRTGNLCVGGSHFINTCILPGAMTEYSRKYPGIKLKLVEASSAYLAEMLADRLIDITFTCREDIIAAFPHYPAFRDHILLAVSPETLSLDCALSADDVIAGRHLAENCPCIPFEAMNELEYILLSEGNNLHDRAVKIFDGAGITPRVKIEISQLSTSYHLARSNFGAAFVSDRMITAGEKGLNFYRIDSPVTEREFYSVLPRREYIPKSVRTFIDVIGRNLQFQA